MASVNPLSRELVFKIVYYGPGLGGKTTTLEHIHATAKPDHRGKLVSLATPVDRTLYFDFLPMRLPPIRGMHVRLQLFTVPGQVYFNATRKLVLTGADGIVFVADSQTARADANLESLDNLRDNLADQGRNLTDVPIVFQYNKQDLPDVLSVAELDKLINRWNAPSLATSAFTGVGVYEALERITHAVLSSFETQMPESVRVSAAAAFDPNEEGLAAALRGASHGEDRPPTSGAIINRVTSSRVTFGSIPPETGVEEAPPIVDKVAIRGAGLPMTTFPDVPDDGWGSKEKLAIAPASDASILTRADSVRTHTGRTSESRSGESPRSRNRPSVLPPKPFAPLIPHAQAPRSTATHAPAPPPNATTTIKEATPQGISSHAPAPPPNATTTIKEATPQGISTHTPAPPLKATTIIKEAVPPAISTHAPVAPPNATVAASTKSFASTDKAPSTEKTVAIPAKAPPTATAKPEVVAAKPAPVPAPVEVVPAKPTPAPAPVAVVAAKPAPAPAPVEVVPAKPTLAPPPAEVVAAKPTLAPPPVEVVPAKPTPAPAPVEVVPAKPAPAPAPVEVVPAKPAPAPAPVEVVPAKPTPVAIVAAKPAPAPAPVEVVPAKPEPEKTPIAAPTVTAQKPPVPFERLDPTLLFSIADLLEPPAEATSAPATPGAQGAKVTTPQVPASGETPRPSAIAEAESSGAGKRIASEPEPAPKMELPKLAELGPLPARTSSTAPVLPGTVTAPEASPIVAPAPATPRATGPVTPPTRPTMAAVAIAEPSKSDSVPAPPPARPLGMLQALVESKRTDSNAPHPSSSKGSSETNRTPTATPPAEKTDAPKAAGLSFADLWPETDRSLVRDVEAAIATGRSSEAIELTDALVTRILTSTATLLGSADAARDALHMPLMLGIDGRRYLAFRSIVGASRGGGRVNAHDALAAYAFAIEVRMAKASVR